MEVILMTDVDKLGQAGDKIKVKDGYARNYLVPRNLAMKATEGALRELERRNLERKRRDKKIKEECEMLASKMATMSCTISMEAGEGDKLFGSVTSEKISEVLSSEGIDIDKRKIILEEPIKALGVYTVDVRLHPEVKTQIRIWVVKK